MNVRDELKKVCGAYNDNICEFEKYMKLHPVKIPIRLDVKVSKPIKKSIKPV